MSHAATTSSEHGPTPRRFGASALAGALVIGLAVGAGGAAFFRHDSGSKSAAAHAADAAKPKYQCPMHPTVVQDHPGDCPICGMKLVLVKDAASTASAASATQAPAQQKYQCPMHPTVVQDHPGDCPICGMKLVPMKSDASAATASAPGGDAPSGDRKIAFYRSPMNPSETSPVPRKDEMGMDYLPVYEDEANGGSASEVAGLATVSIDPQRQQLIGLRTAPVTRGPVGGSVRTVGRVVVDETRVKAVNVKVGGYVERIFVDFVGKPVAKGDPLFTLYSPELVSAQNEYLLALQTQRALSSAGAVGSAGEDLVTSSRRRLKLWDITDAEIEQLERTGKPKKNLTIYSPIAGVVTRKAVVQGATLQAGATPYEITDLSTVWVLADVYESELSRVHVGDAGKLQLRAYPNRTFDGRVVFLDPTLDPRTRTVKARLEFANATGEIKPELFGDVVLEGPRREGLRIPADAVVPTGTDNVVFVSLGDGKFRPRHVKLGVSDGDQVEVVSGLGEGEAVVTRANFLIDSESRLRASLAAMSGN